MLINIAFTYKINKNYHKIEYFCKLSYCKNMKINLKKFRKQNGLSQQEIAKHLNIAQSSYSAYETGKNEPDIKTILALAKILHVSTDELLGAEIEGFVNTNLISAEEKNIIDIMSKLNKDNLNKLEAYATFRLEEQNGKR